MGFTIIIGERTAKGSRKIKIEKHENAPAFGEPTDYENQRWPSYTAWGEFLRQSGLVELFNNDLMRSHPGTFPIKKKHLKAIEEAQTKYKALHHRHVAGFNDSDPESEQIITGTLARLEWLVYWTRHAVNNYEKPLIYNS